MTALCGGGASEIKPGVAGNNIISGGLISEGLLAISPWLLPFALLVDAFLYDATAQCTTDPPALPVFDSTDLTNCIGGILNPNCPTTLTKIKDLLLRWLWFQYCQCSSTTTPTFVNPTQPANTSTTTTPTNTNNCWANQILNYLPTANSSTVGVGTPNEQFGIGLGFGGTSNRFGGNNAFATLPTGFTTITWQLFVNNEGASPLPIEIWAYAWTAADGFIAAFPWPIQLAASTAVSSGRSGVLTIPATSGLAKIEIFPLWTATGSTVGTNTANITISIQCVPANTAPVNCADNEAILAVLQLIYQLLQSVYLSIPPQLNSFAESTAHSVSGSGNFTTGTGVIGVKVVSTVPSSYGENIGDPTVFFDIGWLTTSAVEGNYKPRRLEHTTELVLFDPLVDQVHYTLSPGVTAVITELVRGP